jgi:hypothetical protein
MPVSGYFLSDRNQMADYKISKRNRPVLVAELNVALRCQFYFAVKTIPSFGNSDKLLQRNENCIYKIFGTPERKIDVPLKMTNFSGENDIKIRTFLKLRGFSPRMNYTDQATAVCR